jgi:hypothetical protein
VYLALLYVHSWLRYAVLALGVWLLVQSALRLRAGSDGSARAARLHTAFLATLDTQLSLGLVLYFLFSPTAAIAMSDLAAAMRDAQLRFFGVEHVATMLIAVAVAHVGGVRAKRKQGPARHRTTLITQAVWLALTLLAIPWPGLDIARPLFRI